MIIQKCRIYNFRTVHDIELVARPYSVLIGANNSGKSNILRAIQFVLESGAKITPEDFCKFNGDADNRLWVEVTFGRLTEQDHHTFKSYVLPNKTICVRKSAEIDSDGKVQITYSGYKMQPNHWWLQKENQDYLTKRSNIEEHSLEIPQLKELLQNSGRITKARVEEFQNQILDEFQDALDYDVVLEAGPFLGQKNFSAGLLPELIFVPAMQDLSEDTKAKGKTLFNRLLTHACKDLLENDSKFAEIQEGLKEIVQLISGQYSSRGDSFSGLRDLEQSITYELKDWDTEATIEIAEPEIQQVLEQGASLWLDDGVLTRAESKGHGLQRALLFALLQTWAAKVREQSAIATEITSRAASTTLILAIEEPEIYLHPHKQRELADSLSMLSMTPQHQVISCSHSPYFIDLSNYRSVTLVSRDDRKCPTVIRQCQTELFQGDTIGDRKSRFRMAHWINPDRGELFFARQVVLVEGETEKAVLPYLARRLGCLDPSVSIIDCGSKHSIPPYIEIMNAFSLNYVVIHDEDPLPTQTANGISPEPTKSQLNTFKLNRQIEEAVRRDTQQVIVLEPDFEGVAGVSKNQGDKKGKALAAIERLEQMSDNELPDELCNVVRKAYSAFDQ